MSEAKSLRVLVCDGDVWIRRALGTLAEEAGFEVIAESVNVIAALNEMTYTRPSLVVLTYESLVVNPLEIIGEIRSGPGSPIVILVSPDSSSLERAKAAGAFAFAAQGDAAALSLALGDAAEFLTTGNQRKRTDRRGRVERRIRQEWSKVTSQRRGDTERRGSGRRDAKT